MEVHLIFNPTALVKEIVTMAASFKFNQYGCGDDGAGSSNPKCGRTNGDPFKLVADKKTNKKEKKQRRDVKRKWIIFSTRSFYSNALIPVM